MRSILAGELPIDEMADIAAACAAEPWIGKDRESLEVQRMQCCYILDSTLQMLHAAPELQRAMAGGGWVVARCC